MKIAILVYNGMTMLDAIGPYEVLAQLPNAEVVFVAVISNIKTLKRLK